MLPGVNICVSAMKILPYCPFGDECDNWNFEDSRPHSERPRYEPREAAMELRRNSDER